MESREPTDVLAWIKDDRPPYRLSVLQALCSIDWDKAHDLDVASEIILRMEAGAIVAGDLEGEARKAHKEAFEYIANAVEASSLPSRDPEFQRYFDKYRKRLDRKSVV